MSLKYEVNVSPFNKSTVDFVYTSVANDKFCFELLSPEMSDEIKVDFAPRPTNIEGLSTFGGVQYIRSLLKARRYSHYTRNISFIGFNSLPPQISDNVLYLLSIFTVGMAILNGPTTF